MSAHTTTQTITLGDVSYVIERPTGRKGSQALALIRALSKASPGLQRDMARFVREYEAENVVELDRAQARMRYPAQPITRDGELVVNAAGDAVMAPSFVDQMTDTDWERAGHRLRLPKSPSQGEIVVAVLDVALETAEEHVYALLALFTLPNADVKRYWREGGDILRGKIAERADELLDDVPADELLELAVVVAEVIDGNLRGKLGELGDRAGNALRLVGLNRTPTTTPQAPSTDAGSTDGPSSSTPHSSTGADEPTDGASTTPSTPPSTSSSSSADSPSSTPSPERNS